MSSPLDLLKGTQFSHTSAPVVAVSDPKLDALQSQILANVELIQTLNQRIAALTGQRASGDKQIELLSFQVQNKDEQIKAIKALVGVLQILNLGLIIERAKAKHETIQLRYDTSKQLRALVAAFDQVRSAERRLRSAQEKARLIVVLSVATGTLLGSLREKRIKGACMGALTGLACAQVFIQARCPIAALQAEYDVAQTQLTNAKAPSTPTPTPSSSDTSQIP